MVDSTNIAAGDFGPITVALERTSYQLQRAAGELTMVIGSGGALSLPFPDRPVPGPRRLWRAHADRPNRPDPNACGRTVDDVLDGLAGWGGRFLPPAADCVGGHADGPSVGGYSFSP